MATTYPKMKKPTVPEGPWHVYGGDIPSVTQRGECSKGKINQIAVHSKKGWGVCSLLWLGEPFSVGYFRALATAKLICAAPKLLSLCVEILNAESSRDLNGVLVKMRSVVYDVDPDLLPDEGIPVL